MMLWHCVLIPTNSTSTTIFKDSDKIPEEPLSFPLSERGSYFQRLVDPKGYIVLQW
jgi:hypothetical protein